MNQNSLTQSVEFKKSFNNVVETLVKYKQENNGILPYEIFMELLKVSKSYTALEILLINSKTNNPILVFREDAKEANWFNKLHIPGMILNQNMDTSKIVEMLIRKEITHDENLVKKLANNYKFAGFIREYEPERNGALADTILVSVQIDFENQKNNLIGKWEEVSPELESWKMVIQQHQALLEWFRTKNKKSIFFDTRL